MTSTLGLVDGDSGYTWLRIDSSRKIDQQVIILCYESI